LANAIVAVAARVDVGVAAVLTTHNIVAAIAGDRVGAGHSVDTLAGRGAADPSRRSDLAEVPNRAIGEPDLLDAPIREAGSEMIVDRDGLAGGVDRHGQIPRRAHGA